uniref:Mediator of RNA polymerase II transcription subunit 23 n=1 Tax=Onchocerca volvulus TaxID=6282 RepID=A0A8R1TXR6_ONCVO
MNLLEGPVFIGAFHSLSKVPNDRNCKLQHIYESVQCKEIVFRNIKYVICRALSCISRGGEEGNRVWSEQRKRGVTPEDMGTNTEAIAASSTTLTAAVGNDAEKLQWIVLNQVEGVQMREMFWDLSKDVDVDVLACSEAVKLLRTMTEEEKTQCCKASLSLLSNKDDPRYIHYERILSSIFMAACNEGVLPLSDCCELLILCTNFTLTTPMDSRKFEYMQKNLHLIDYKGLRNILKLLVVERMQEVPSTITHHHRHMLLPVENMLLTLIDRQLNLLPCIFTITELHRVSSNSRAFLLPRVAKKFNDMFISFRPLTEMVTIIGRSWLYPIAAHISFPVSTPSWKLEVTTTRLHQRAHLPYKSELFAPQSFLLYTLLRQPRGKDTISYVMRQNTNLTPQRLQCDELLHMIILEAMSEMEKTDARLDDPANQYQWMNITQTVTFSLLHGNASFSRLLKILYESLSETVYRKGRDELMWVILQYVAVYIDRVSNEEMVRVAEIYNLLYSDEQTWSGADTDPLLFVRFLVPAAIWIHFYKKLGNSQTDVLPKPSESLWRQIQFLQERTADSDPNIQNVADHNAVLAAVANAYSSDMPNFQKLVLTAIDVFLDGSPEEINTVWHLPYGIISYSKKTPLPLSLIDSLTFHARNHLFQLCLLKLTAMLSIQQTQKLPSPATIDTLVRLAVTTEFEYGVKQVLALLSSTLVSVNKNTNLGPAQQDRSRDLLFVLCDILSYRFISYPFPVGSKVNLMLWCYTALGNSQVQMNIALCSALEQVMLRYWMWNSPQEMFYLSNAFLGKQGKLAVIFNVTNPAFCDPQHANIPTEQQYTNSHVSLELLRCLLLSIVDDGAADTVIYDELMHRVIQEVHQVQEIIYAQGLAAEEQLLKFFSGERRQTIFCVVYNMLFETKKIHPVIYSLHFYQMIGILNDMAFNLHLIPLDRLLTSLVLHPTDDGATEIAMLIIHSLIGSYPDLHNRITALVHIIPSNKIGNTSAAFFNKMSEYYSQFPELSYKEMEAKMRREMQIELGMRPIEQPIVSPELHMPIYYGNIMERILPIVDIILFRAIETVVADQLFTTLLMCFKPCYRYHPQPAAYMYSVLYCLDKTISHTVRARDFVLEICGQLEDRDGKYALLTPSFISDNHQLSLPSQFCQALVDRILQASNYAHQPPVFASKDWRFAEMPPAGQALTGACIELLASPHAPLISAHALIDLVFIRPLHQPYATINAVALILTALPVSFQQVFYEHIVSVLDSEALHGDPSVCFGSLENECFLLTENQLLTNLALGHAYLQHCNTSSLAALPEFVRDQLAPKLVTEAQLIFVLRLVVPILQRFYDAKERSKQIQDLAVDVYKMTVKVNERVGVLKYEDSICDFLYHMKYMYVGDFVKNEAEQAIQRLSPSMRDKLKYISHTQINATVDLPHKLAPGPFSLF